jgi:hypothetical protein
VGAEGIADAGDPTPKPFEIFISTLETYMRWRNSPRNSADTRLKRLARGIGSRKSCRT